MKVFDPAEEKSRGMILLVVLWSVALMTVIVVALSAFAQKNISVAGVQTDRLRSELALEAGLAVAGGLILAQRPENRIFLNGAPAAIDIGDGKIIEIRVTDAAGLADFNRADPALLMALAERLELGGETVAALQNAIKTLRKTEGEESGKEVPRRDKPGQAAADQASERAAATGEQTEEAHEPKPLPPALMSAAQLLGYEGITQQTLDKLLPFITLYSSDGKVNPMAAPEVILDAIPELGPNERKVLQDAAQRRTAQSNDVKSILEEREAFLTTAEPKTFVVGLKILSGPGIIAGSTLTASIMLDEAGKSPFQVLAWSW